MSNVLNPFGMLVLGSMALGTPVATGQYIPALPAGGYQLRADELNEKKMAARIFTSVSFYNQQMNFRKAVEKITGQFANQVERLSHELEERFGIVELRDAFVAAASYFLAMGFHEKIRVDLTLENSLLFRTEKDGVQTYLETFFKPETQLAPTTVLNIWMGKTQVVTQSGNMEEMIALHQEAFTDLKKRGQISDQNKKRYYEVPGLHSAAITL